MKPKSKKMKRKKWSEIEEQTLISKYADLQNSGILTKLRTREKKFKPIADHVNSIHHFQDPVNFPFKWSWRDVSIKVQNMRHQYLGVKQKIRVSDGEFNWDDGVHHWENFVIYKEVFGDVELEVKERNNGDFSSNDLGLGLGFEMIDFEEFEDEDESEEEENEGSSSVRGKMGKRKRIGLLSARVLELRDVLVKREERRKERDFARDKISMLKEESRMRNELLMHEKLIMEEDRLEERQLELEELKMRLKRREFDRDMRLEQELDDERRWRRKMEEKREEEEMEWKERMLGLQIDHEKQMMQIQVDACQYQMQVVGVMSRFMSQLFGTASDGLGGVGIGGLHSQVLDSMQHPVDVVNGDLREDNNNESDSPSAFI